MTSTTTPHRVRSMVLMIAVASLALFVVAPATPAAAYDFASTNDDNRDDGLPHVNLVETGPGTVTLQFVNDNKWLAFFEVRIDGVDVALRDPHRELGEGEVENPGVCIDGLSVYCEPDPVVETFFAKSTVEVRHALGAESDAFFDWTAFDVDPIRKQDCKRGGWEDFGFRNQGQCIRFVNTGRNSR